MNTQIEQPRKRKFNITLMLWLYAAIFGIPTMLIITEYLVSDQQYPQILWVVPIALIAVMFYKIANIFYSVRQQQIKAGIIASPSSQKGTVVYQNAAKTPTPDIKEIKAISFAGKAEVIWLLVIGIVSFAAFIAARIESFPSAVVFIAGAVACVFALPFGLIAIAVILSALLQIFTPSGGSSIPLFPWKGSVDGLSPDQLREFEAKPRMNRFAKVYLWLSVNSLVGAAVTLIAFVCLYTFMQLVQQQHH